MTEYLAGLAYAVEFGLSSNHELTDVWKSKIKQLTERAADRDWKNRRFDSLRIHYLAAIGDGDAEKLREELLARDNPARSLIMNSLRHFGQGKFESFSSELGFRQSGEAKLIRAFLQIEQASAEERKALAHQICSQDFPPTMNRSCEWHLVAINLLLLAGDKEAAKDYAVESLEGAPIYADRWAFRTLQYLADPTPAHKARLSALAHPFSDPMGYIELAFGMQAFAEGNRDKALEHFRKSVATGKLDWFSPCIADAMLRRMEDEEKENWPAWIEWQ